MPVRNIGLICLTIILFAIALVGLASCGQENKYPQGGPYYFGSFGGYTIPFKPIEKLTEDEAKLRPVYYTAYYDYRQRIVSFAKYVNGKKEFSDKYIYTYALTAKDEYLEHRELTVSNGDIQTDYFDKSGKIIKTEKETRVVRIKRLIAQLEDTKSWDTPLAAADELTELDAKEALPAIIKALKNGKRSDCTCGYAMDEAIIKLGGKSVIPDMLKLLKSKNWVIRMVAVNVLSGVGAKETIPQIKKLSNDPEEGVRCAVSNALNDLGAGPVKQVPASPDIKTEQFIKEFCENEAVDVAKKAGYDYKAEVRECLAKNKNSMHTIFWLTENAGFDAASAEGNSGVLGGLLKRLGDDFFGSCLAKESKEIRGIVRSMLLDEFGCADDDSAETKAELKKLHKKYPKTFPR